MDNINTLVDNQKHLKSDQGLSKIGMQQQKQYRSEDQYSNNILNMAFILSQSELQLSKSSIGFSRNFSISDISEIKHQENPQSDCLDFDSQQSQFSSFSVKKSSFIKNKSKNYRNNCENLVTNGLNSEIFCRKNYNRNSKFLKKPHQYYKDQLSSQKQFGKSIKTFFSEQSSSQQQPEQKKNSQMRLINNKGKLIHK